MPTAFVSPYGGYDGRLEPGFSKAAPLRIAQVSRHLDAEFRLAVSRLFVAGKLGNMRTLLLRYRRTKEVGGEAIQAAAESLGDIIRRVPSAPDLPALLGLEGVGSRHYFSVFGLLMRSSLPFSFERRSRRPPADPVNSLLSFAYVLLSKEMVTAASLAHLDPCIGYFHEAKYGRPALALDLMEEFRPIVADSVVLTLLNNGAFTPDDFEVQGKGHYLSTPARKRFYLAWEQRKNDEITHPVFGYKVSYWRAFELQARFLAKVIQGEMERYQPLLVR